MIKTLRTFNRKVVQPIVRLLQSVLVTVLLVVVYFLGLGITYIFMLIFNRRMLFNTRSGDTFWREARGYEPDMEDCLRQS